MSALRWSNEYPIKARSRLPRGKKATNVGGRGSGSTSINENGPITIQQGQGVARPWWELVSNIER